MTEALFFTMIEYKSYTGINKPMDALSERLDAKLREWEPDIAATVRERITEIIDLADRDALDIMRSRAVETGSFGYTR